MKAILGTTPQGKDISINMPKLLESRLLVTAASGGGKSQTLRRIYEQTAPHVQQLIIDPEGEFSTLREKFDYVICAPHDGDALAHPRTASLLARRLLESGVSAILDIYDLDMRDRLSFVKIFLETMINAPKNLWHPVLIGLDEAHEFAPEGRESICAQAVAAMATRGRKRGFCLMPSTQRLSKLNKDVAAEMQNKLIGGMNLDLDVKRAAADLGMTPKEAIPLLRNLEPGEFYCYGPALSRDVIKVEVGPVITTHLKAGQRMMKAPPAPSAKVKKELESLADLPQQAAEEAKTTAELQALVAQLRREVAAKPAPVVLAGRSDAEIQTQLDAVNKEAFDRGIEEGYAAGLKDAPEVSESVLVAFGSLLNRINNAQTVALKEGGELIADLRAATAKKKPVKPLLKYTARALAQARPAGKAAMTTPATRQPASYLEFTEMAPAKQKILDALAVLEAHGVKPAPRAVIGAQVGKSVNTSSFKNDLGALRTAGLIDYDPDGGAFLLDAGHAAAKPPEKALTLKDFQESFLELHPPSKRRILEELIKLHPDGIDRAGLGELVGKSINTSSFKNDLGALRTLGALDYLRDGGVIATKLLFPEGLA